MDNTILDESTSQRLHFDRLMLGIHTAIPGIIESFNAQTNLADVQPAIKMKIAIPGAKVSFLNLPVIRNVPICLACSIQAGFFITVPIKKGDECLLIFSERAIDNFIKYGGIVFPTEGNKEVSPRHHDITDAICIPGIITLPNAIADWNQNAIEIRNADRTIYLNVNDSGINIKGNVTVEGDVVADGISLKTHIHSDPQGGVTGPPQ